MRHPGVPERTGCESRMPDHPDVVCFLDADHPGFHLSVSGGEAWSDPYRHAGEIVVTEGGYPCSVDGKPCPCGFDSDDCR